MFAKLQRHRSAVVGGAVTFGLLFAVVTGLASAEARRLEAERAITQESELRRVSSVLTKDLDVALGELRSLAFWIEHEPGFATSRFDEYSRRLLERHSMLRATVVLKDDVISQVYPSHPELLGLDASQHRTQGRSVAQLRRTREPLVSGPTNLLPGGDYLILRVPVHRPPAAGTDTYWGHVAFVFDMTPMEQLLTRSSRTLDAHLGLVDADGLGTTAAFALGALGAADTADQTLDILVPAERWRVSVRSLSPPASGVSALLLTGGVLLSLVGGVAIGLLLSTTRRLHEQNDELQKLATTDALTGAFNRRAVVERTEAELVLSQRTGKAFSVLLLDLDHFKAINDEYGHAVGDTALKVIVATVKAELRQTDVVGRWGGEEFLLIAVQTPEAGALELAERLRLRISETQIPAGFTALRLSASFGIAESSATDTAESLIDRADQGLYQAKAKGRNRCASVPVPASSHIVPARRATKTSEQSSL
ncbi:MAG TPA: diguanylate cyclase [Polyangiaceae bacterium]